MQSGSVAELVRLANEGRRDRTRHLIFPFLLLALGGPWAILVSLDKRIVTEPGPTV